MKFSNRSKYLLLALLALLNILIRIPSIPHERGSADEFTMHILANSLSTFGEARWWIHPSSVFGFYPYSYASVSPFAFSGISQCTGINIEWIAWIFCTLLGIFVMFSAYIMAREIKNDDLFKFLVAFTVSLSLGVLNYLTWQISARGFFIALLPFFIYILLKSRIFAVRFGALTFISFILLMATHHYYAFTLPIIFGFIILIIFYKLKGHITKFIRFPDILVSVILIIMFFGMFSIPFFTRIFAGDSRYDALHLMLENTIRYSGPLFLFAMVGLSYLMFKHDREYGEWFLLFTSIFFIPFMYINTYAHYFAAVLICILICIALVNIAKACEGKRKRVFAIIIIILLLFVSFSGFYQHWRTNIGGKKPCQWYIEDATYKSALWIKDNINENKRMIGSSQSDLTSTRVFAISEVPTLVMPEADITYGFVNVSNIKVTKNSPLSEEFYMHSPYVLLGIYAETVSAKWSLGAFEVDSKSAQRIILRYNLSYYIEDRHFSDAFTESLQGGRRSVPVYDNGRICIWDLDE